jgi:long-chain fatty acid transport protein
MRNKKLILASLALISSNVLGAGYSTHSTSTAAIATSYAGSSTGAHDISNMYYNPAILSKFDKTQFVAGLTYLDVDIDPQNENVNVLYNSAAGQVGDAGKNVFIPNLYFATKINDKNNLGIAINSAYGLATEYNESWVGSKLDNVNSITTVNLNSNLSHKLTDKLSLAFGVNAQKMKSIKSLISTTGHPIKYRASDWGYGYSLGVNYDLYDKLSLGLGYNSKVDHELNGTFQVPADNIRQDAVLKLSTPETATIGAKYMVNDKLNLMSDIIWTRWSRNRIADVNESGSGVDIITISNNWNDSFMYSLGGDYQYDDNLLVRFGTAFETGAASDSNRNADVPLGDVYWLTTGINYDLGNNLSIDASYLHQFYENVSVNDVDAKTRSQNLNARYRTQVNVLSLALKKNF